MSAILFSHFVALVQVMTITAFIDHMSFSSGLLAFVCLLVCLLLFLSSVCIIQSLLGSCLHLLQGQKMSNAYRKKCSCCAHNNHFNSKKCKRCSTPLLSVGVAGGRPPGTTAREGYGVGVAGGGARWHYCQ